MTQDNVARLVDAVPDWGELSDPFAKLSVPELAAGIMPETIERFARHEALVKGVQFHGPAMAALAVCAAAIPDHVQIRVKVHEAWYEACRLWLALIGPVSAKKSPLLKTAMRPLKRAEKEAFAVWATEKEFWDKTDKESRGPEPILRRYVLNDSTIESVGKIAAENPQGLLLERDELAGWFGAMDKYSSGRGAAADRGFWLQAWNGSQYTIDRISRPSLFIPNLSVSIIGGIQPDAIRRIAKDAVDDGLLQRLLPVVLGPAGPGEDTHDMGHSFEDYDALIARLTNLPETTVKFSADAQTIRREFAAYANKLATLESVSPQLGAFCGKLDGYFARFALAFHACNPTRIQELVSGDTARRVERLMKTFTIPHAMNFYLDIMSENGPMADARAIAGYILAHKIERFTSSTLTAGCWHCKKKTREDIAQMIDPLEAYGWIMPEALNDYPPRAWVVNPEVHTRFEQRAQEETTRRQGLREMVIESLRKEPTP